jgi:hypothetical protein
MEIKRLSMDEIRLRVPYEVEALPCTVCEVVLDAPALWCCDDHDLATNGQMLCNVVYLCDDCVKDEAKIRRKRSPGVPSYAAGRMPCSMSAGVGSKDGAGCPQSAASQAAVT